MCEKHSLNYLLTHNTNNEIVFFSRNEVESQDNNKENLETMNTNVIKTTNSLQDFSPNNQSILIPLLKRKKKRRNNIKNFAEGE